MGNQPPELCSLFLWEVEAIFEACQAQRVMGLWEGGWPQIARLTGSSKVVLKMTSGWWFKGKQTNKQRYFSREPATTLRGPVSCWTRLIFRTNPHWRLQCSWYKHSYPNPQGLPMESKATKNSWLLTLEAPFQNRQHGEGTLKTEVWA